MTAMTANGRAELCLHADAGVQTIADLVNVTAVSLYGNDCRRYDSTPLSAALCEAGTSASVAAAAAAVADPMAACGTAFCCGPRLPLPADPAAAVAAAMKPLRAAAGDPQVHPLTFPASVAPGQLIDAARCGFHAFSA